MSAEIYQPKHVKVDEGMVVPSLIEAWKGYHQGCISIGDVELTERFFEQVYALNPSEIREFSRFALTCVLDCTSATPKAIQETRS